MYSLTNAEYLSDFNGFELYVVQEIGFSHKMLAKNNKLYAKFKDYDSSVFCEIFNHDYLSTSEMYQIWIIDMKAKTPIGLSIAFVFEDDRVITSTIKEYKEDLGQIIGQIHCYIKPEYRGLGLIKETIPYLENFLYKKCPLDKLPCIVMEDKAYSLAKHTKKCSIFPSVRNLSEKNLKIYDNFIQGGERYEDYKHFENEPIEEIKIQSLDIFENIELKINSELSSKKIN